MVEPQALARLALGFRFIFLYEREREHMISTDMGAFRHQIKVLDLLELELQAL